MLPIDFADESQQNFILVASVIAILFGLWNLKAVMSIQVADNPGRYVDQTQMKQIGSNEEEVKQVIDDEIVEQNMAFVS